LLTAAHRLFVGMERAKQAGYGSIPVEQQERGPVPENAAAIRNGLSPQDRSSAIWKNRQDMPDWRNGEETARGNAPSGKSRGRRLENGQAGLRVKPIQAQQTYTAKKQVGSDRKRSLAGTGRTRLMGVDGFLDGADDIVDLGGLAQKGPGAPATAFHPAYGGVVAREHDTFQVRPGLAQPVGQLDPVHAGHAHIEQGHGDVGASSHDVESFFAPFGQMHVNIPALETLAEKESQIFSGDFFVFSKKQMQRHKDSP
jgi:hypothetical protein